MAFGSTIDTAVGAILVAGLVVVVVGRWLWAWRGAGKYDHAVSFFFDGRSNPWWAVALSLSGALVVDSTAVWALLSGGLLVGVSALLPALAVCASFPVLAWIVLPRVWMGSASRVTAGFTSIPSWLGQRFGFAFRLYFVIVTLVYFMVSVIPVGLHAGSLLLALAVGPGVSTAPYLIGCVISGGFVALATGMPGIMTAQVYTAALALLGAATLLFQTSAAVNGWSGLVEVTHHASEAVQAGLRPPFVHIIQEQGPYAWPAMLFALPLAAVWRVCLDQRLMQRIACSKTVKQGQTGAVCAAWLAGLASFAWVFAGMAGRLVAARNLGCKDGTGCINTGFAYESILEHLIPAGFLGLFYFIAFAAIIVPLSATLHSVATLIVADLIAPGRRAFGCMVSAAGSPSAAVRSTRCATILATGVALCWVPVMPALAHAPDAFACFVEVGLLLSGPLVTVSVIGTVWRRVSPCSSTVALVVGHVPVWVRLIVRLAAAGSTNTDAVSTVQSGVHHASLPGSAALSVMLGCSPLYFTLACALLSLGVMTIFTALAPRPAPQRPIVAPWLEDNGVVDGGPAYGPVGGLDGGSEASFSDSDSEFGLGNGCDDPGRMGAPLDSPGVELTDVTSNNGLHDTLARNSPTKDADDGSGSEDDSGVGAMLPRVQANAAREDHDVQSHGSAVGVEDFKEAIVLDIDASSAPYSPHSRGAPALPPRSSNLDAADSLTGWKARIPVASVFGAVALAVVLLW